MTHTLDFHIMGPYKVLWNLERPIYLEEDEEISNLVESLFRHKQKH